MTHTITNNKFSAKISDLGAELKSFTNDNDQEYIWSGDPEIWNGTAPVLFPIVGKLKNNEYKFEGKTYKMNQHGFARKLKFNVVNKTESAISFKLNADVNTKLIYPFNFELIVTFSIYNNQLSVNYAVTNNGDQQMPFTIGSHPAFCLQTSNCKLNDYYIEFDKNETLDCYVINDGLLDEQPISNYLNNENIIPLHKNIFNNDALVFKNIKSQQITIKNKVTNYKLTVKTGGAPHLGIWAKPAAPYVCIEPWFGYADNTTSTGELLKKESMITLKPKNSFSAGYQIII